MNSLLSTILAVASVASVASAQWRQSSAAPAPSPRHSFGMAADLVNGESILFGGTTGVASTPNGTFTLTNNQTWRHDGNVWSQLVPAASPSGRWASSSCTTSRAIGSCSTAVGLR